MLISKAVGCCTGISFGGQRGNAPINRPTGNLLSLRLVVGALIQGEFDICQAKCGHPEGLKFWLVYNVLVSFGDVCRCWCDPMSPYFPMLTHVTLYHYVSYVSQVVQLLMQLCCSKILITTITQVCHKESDNIALLLIVCIAYNVFHAALGLQFSITSWHNLIKRLFSRAVV